MGMYNVTVFANPEKLDALKYAYEKIGVQGMSVTRVEGCGTQHGVKGYYRGTVTDMSLLPKIKVEVMVGSDIPWETVVEAAKGVLKTEAIGSGKIFVYEVAHVFRVRTDDVDEDALRPPVK